MNNNLDNMLKNYTKGSDHFGKIVLKRNSPYLLKMLDRMFDRWDTNDKKYDRWGTMNAWVQRYRKGATFNEMVNCPEAETFGKWWAQTADYVVMPEMITDRIKDVVNMIVSIADNGYDEKRYSETPGWQPIRISIDGMGIVYTWDGAHRAMILAALDRDVPVVIEYVRTNFLQTILPIKTLYQPSSHPCVQHLPIIRKDLGRYKAVLNSMKFLGVKTACEIGCAEAEGLIILAESGAKMTGIENDNMYYTLAYALCEVTGLGTIKSSIDPIKKYDAFIGLSVWQHLARNLMEFDRWIDLTKEAKYQYVEMPQPGSTTFYKQLTADTGWIEENVGEELTKHIMERGGYTKSEVLFTDKLYGDRKTILLSK